MWCFWDYCLFTIHIISGEQALRHLLDLPRSILIAWGLSVTLKTCLRISSRLAEVIGYTQEYYDSLQSSDLQYTLFLHVSAHKLDHSAGTSC